MVAIALVDDAQHLVLLQEVGILLHDLAQAIPVFALAFDVPKRFVQFRVTLLHVFGEGMGTAFGQHPVVGHGGFGRGISGHVNPCDGQVGILLHGIDGGLHLVQFGPVVLIVRQYLVAVLAVLQAGGAYFRTAFHRLRFGLLHDCHFVNRFPVWQDVARGQGFVSFVTVGATGHVGAQFQRAVQHPWLIRDFGFVVQGLCFPVAAAQAGGFVSGWFFFQCSPALPYFASDLPVHTDRSQGLFTHTVCRANDGKQLHGMLLLHVQVVQADVHLHPYIGPVLCHLSVLHLYGFQIGSLCQGRGESPGHPCCDKDDSFHVFASSCII